MDRGKGGAKRSVLTEAHGIPIAIVVDGINRHDIKRVQPTLEDLKLRRPGPAPKAP
jgi:putative transposase